MLPKGYRDPWGCGHRVWERSFRRSAGVDEAGGGALGAPVVELHTGAYCDGSPGYERDAQLERIIRAAKHAGDIGLECHAGHGLTFDTVKPVAEIANIAELNIGHFLVGEAIFVGLGNSISEIRRLMVEARVGK